jgi:uncharacterized membrane protein YbhN (UPF0104 family)
MARVAIAALVLIYLFMRIDTRAVIASMRALPCAALLTAALLVSSAAAFAVLRWRILLRAYGAHTLPTYRQSFSLFGGALVYNLLPSAVGGDVYRGYATRHCFADSAATRSVSVIFVERALGLAGLLLLVALASLLAGHAEPEVLLYSAIGLCTAFAAIVAISTGQRLGQRLPWPRRIRALMQRLPAIERPAYFASACALSIVTHAVIASAGHVLIHSLEPAITLGDSMASFPLGTLASYFPLTVAGAGARDTALVMVLAKLHVPRDRALATSLCLFGCDLMVASIGGLLHSGIKLPAAGPARAHLTSQRQP